MSTPGEHARVALGAGRVGRGKWQLGNFWGWPVWWWLACTVFRNVDISRKTPGLSGKFTLGNTGCAVRPRTGGAKARLLVSGERATASAVQAGPLPSPASPTCPCEVRLILSDNLHVWPWPRLEHEPPHLRDGVDSSHPRRQRRTSGAAGQLPGGVHAMGRGGRRSRLAPSGARGP